MWIIYTSFTNLITEGGSEEQPLSRCSTSIKQYPSRNCMIGFVCISARILGHHTESSRLEVCDISLMCNIVSNYYNCLYYNCYHLDHYDHYDHNFYYFSGFFFRKMSTSIIVLLMVSLIFSMVDKSFETFQKPFVSFKPAIFDCRQDQRLGLYFVLL